MEAIYEVEVTTGSMTHAGTFNNVFITLIGTQGESERTKLDSYGRDFKTGMKVKYKVATKSTLATLLLVRLEKDMFLPENDWFCSMISVKTPEQDVIFFPSYRWMAEGEVIELREAKGSLGHYPEDYFCQTAAQKILRNHEAEFSFMSEFIKDRNLGLNVHYTYLCPDRINNSVSI